MEAQRWTQDALHNHPVKLTDNQKAQLLEAVPELENHLINIEKICSGFLYWRECKSTRPTKAEVMAYHKGDKHGPGYIAKLKKCLESNFDLMQTFDEASPWLTMHRSGPLFTSLKAVNAQLIIAIKKAEKQAAIRPANLSTLPIPEQLIKLKKIMDNGYPTNDSQNFHYHYLIFALAELYFEATGREVVRGQSNTSTLTPILAILDSVIKCGLCPGYTTQAIRTRKEINNLDQGL